MEKQYNIQKRFEEFKKNSADFCEIPQEMLSNKDSYILKAFLYKEYFWNYRLFAAIKLIIAVFIICMCPFVFDSKLNSIGTIGFIVSIVYLIPAGIIESFYYGHRYKNFTSFISFKDDKLSHKVFKFFKDTIPLLESK